MAGRLDPVQTKSPPPAVVEVKPAAQVEVKKIEIRHGRLGKVKWKEAPKPPGPDATDAEKAQYKRYYDSQTTVNGCSVPGVSLAQEGSPVAGYRSPENVAACNAHDVSYGRGGSGDDRKAADVELWRQIKANGQPVRATVTYYGVRAFGWMFFSYRDEGQLPIPEGK
jgi:hypothetical protein